VSTLAIDKHLTLFCFPLPTRCGRDMLITSLQISAMSVLLHTLTQTTLYTDSMKTLGGCMYVLGKGYLIFCSNFIIYFIQSLLYLLQKLYIFYSNCIIYFTQTLLCISLTQIMLHHENSETFQLIITST
jgi:hypothetical protein